MRKSLPYNAALALAIGAAAIGCGSTSETIVSSTPGSTAIDDKVPAIENPKNTVTTIENLGPDVGGPTAEDAARNPSPKPREYPAGDEGADAAELEAIKSEAANLLVTAKATRRLPVDPTERAARARALLEELDGKSAPRLTLLGGDAAERAGTLPGAISRDTTILEIVDLTSAPQSRGKAQADLRIQMDTIFSDPQFSGFVDNDFVPEKWIGVSIKGDAATVSVVGHERVKANPNTMVDGLGDWQDLDSAQFDISLVRIDGTWRLLQVDQFSLQSGR